MDDLRIQRPTAPRSSPRARRRPRRVLLLTAAALVLAAAGLGALGYDAASRVRQHLLEGEAAVERGRERLLDGEAAPAVEEFRRALASFREASDGSRSPVLRIAGWVPVLRRTPDTVAEVSDAAVDVATAGLAVAEAIAELPGGLEGLAPAGGGLPLDAYPKLAPAVQEAARLVSGARARVAATPRSFLIGPVGPARRDALARLAELERTFRTAGILLDGFPEMLGAAEPRRYFFGAQNPAELRGTGGLVGAYSIATVERGRFDFGTFRPIQELPNLDVGQVPAPSEDYARNYDQFGGAGFWLNVNMTPDFPSAARAILSSYEVATGERLDGVVLADPFALEALLEVTGPVEVPRLGIEIGAGEVVDFVSNEAYARIRNSAIRKVVLGAVAERAFARFMEQTDADLDALRTLAEAAGEGHVLVYSADEQVQRALAESNVGGAFGRTGRADALAVIQNNSGANKVDYYLERTVEHRVRLAPGGAANEAARITLANGAPTEGPPRYVIGPYEDVSEVGESVALLNVYCAGCRLASAVRDGEPAEVLTGTEEGLRFFQQYLRIPSSATTALSYRWAARGVWQGDEGGGSYRLHVFDQPTLRPTRTRIDIVAPPGTRIVEATAGMIVRGGRATWEGTPEYRQELMVRFERPWAARVWRTVLRVLTD